MPRARTLRRLAAVAVALLGPLSSDARAQRALEAPPIPREFRAVWVSPVWGGGAGDWPSRAGLPADSQKAEMRALLDRARAIGLNAVVLHVRTAGDAFYPTPIAPWTAFLSGTSGVAPSPAYDPLAYAIEEAHARGLQLHAWFNPFRAILPNIARSAAPSHVTRAHPDWIRKYGSQTWIDPGIPAAREHVLGAVVDVVRRYDVDGVHLDDYFYPYRESERVRRKVGTKWRTTTRDIAFPDDASWRRYGAGKGFATRADWRRANVDTFIAELYRRVKAEKTTTVVGISPFGIWRPGAPAGITGLDAYGEIYADSRKWLREGWLDYLAPQLYWTLDGTQHRFVRLDQWWQTQNPAGRHIWPGMFTSQVNARRNPWSTEEIAAQVLRLREGRASDVRGHVHFRMGALAAGAGPLGGLLKSTVYTETALVPAFPWLGARAPAPPMILAASAVRNLAEIRSGDSTAVAWWVMQSRTPDGQWTTTVHPGAWTSLAVDARADRVVLRALGRTGLLSAPTEIRTEHP